MRNFRVFKMCWIMCIVWFGLATCCFAADIKSVDIVKVKKSPFTNYIQNVVWPSNKVIKEKQISKELIPDEIADLKHYLSYMLKPEYIPSNDIVDANTIALKAFRDKHDFLFLEYNTKEVIIQVVDYTGLTVLYSPKKQKKVDSADEVKLAEYVKSIAMQVINYPKLDNKINEPRVFISSLDVGKSKCGKLYYPTDRGREWFWYSTMRYWSDGEDVLFLIGKIGPNKDIRERTAQSKQPKDHEKPRKFKKAKKEEKVKKEK